MRELVSVIVPVYAAAPYIVETIEMVRRQTCTEWELLLIEDRSPDESAEAVRELFKGLAHRDLLSADTDALDVEEQARIHGLGLRSAEEYIDRNGQRIVLACKARNEGAAAARNTGLELAKGRYIAYLDADDVWVPEKLQKELRFMKDKQAGFVFSAYEFGDEHARPTGKVVHVPPELSYRQALSRTVIFTTTVLLDRTLIPKELMKMPIVESEDTATWWQILRAGHPAYGLDEVLAVYRRPARSLSSNKLTAIRRIWNLYRRQEGLSAIASVRYFIPWAYRAAVRRL